MLFPVLFADGYVWGRGALDVKVTVCGLLEAAEYLLSKGFVPERTIYFAFGHDEETGGVNGQGEVAKLLTARHVELECVCDEGGIISEGLICGVSKPIALIGVAEKGYLSLELAVKSTGGHSSAPPKETAIGILSKAVCTLESRQFPSKLEGPSRTMFEYLAPEMPAAEKILLSNLWLTSGLMTAVLSSSPQMAAMLRTTVAPTMLSASPKDNILPARARAVVNFRIAPRDTIESVKKYVIKIIDDPRVEIGVLGYHVDPSPVADISGTGFSAVQKTLAETCGDVIAAPYLVIGATDSRWHSDLTKNAFRFMPIVYKKDDLARMHGLDERVACKQYIQSVNYYVRFIENMQIQ